MAAFDRLTASEINTLAAAGNTLPQGIWANNTHVYVTDGRAAKVFAYARNTGAHDASRDFDTLAAAGNNNPSGVWSDESALYVVDTTDNRVYAYDFQTKVRNSALDITLQDVDGAVPFATGIWGIGNLLYVVYTNINKVVVYDTVLKTRKPELDFAGAVIPTDTDQLFGVWSNGTIIWIGDSSENILYAFNRETKMGFPQLDFRTLRARAVARDFVVSGATFSVPSDIAYIGRAGSIVYGGSNLSTPELNAYTIGGQPVTALNVHGTRLGGVQQGTSGLAYDGTYLLLLNRFDSSVTAVQNGAVVAGKGITGPVVNAQGLFQGSGRTAFQRVSGVAIAYDTQEKNVLIFDQFQKKIIAFRSGAHNPAGDISADVIRSANPNIRCVGMDFDGRSLLVLDAESKSVFAFSNGVRDTSKDISASAIVSANPLISPAGIVWLSGAVGIYDSGSGNVYGFNSRAVGARLIDLGLSAFRGLLTGINPSISLSGVDFDPDNSYFLDKDEKAVRVFTRGSLASVEAQPERNITPALIDDETVNVRDVAWDGSSYLVLDDTQPRVLSFRYSATSQQVERETAKDIAATIVTSAYSTSPQEQASLTGGTARNITSMVWDGSSLILWDAAFNQIVALDRSPSGVVSRNASKSHASWTSFRNIHLVLGHDGDNLLRSTRSGPVQSVDGSTVTTVVSAAALAAIDTGFSVSAIVWTGDTLYIHNSNDDVTYAFTKAGARVPILDIPAGTLRERSSSVLWVNGMAWDGSRIMAADSYTDSVFAYQAIPAVVATRNTAQEVSPTVMKSANASIDPVGVAIGDDKTLYILDDNAKAVWAFKDGARASAGDVAASVVKGKLGATVSLGGMAFHDDDILVASSSGRVARFTAGAAVNDDVVTQVTATGASSGLSVTGLAYDGATAFLLDSTTTSVFAFTNGAYDSSRDLSAALLRSARSTIVPTGIAYGEGGLMVVDSSSYVFAFSPYFTLSSSATIEVEALQGIHSVGNVMYVVSAGTQIKVFAFEMPAAPVAPRFAPAAPTALDLAVGTAIPDYDVPAVIAGFPTPVYTASNLPPGIVFNAQTLKLSGTPQTPVLPADMGFSGRIKITATNDYGSRDLYIQWRRLRPTAPVFPAPVNNNNRHKLTVNSQARFTIPEAVGFPPAVYTLETALPSGLSFDPVRRMFFGTPDTIIGNSVDRQAINILATNSVGTGRYTVEYWVEAAPTVPVSPFWQNPTRAAVQWSRAATFTNITIPAVDRGTPTPAYSAEQLPAGVSFDPSSRVISGAPNDVGSGAIVIVARSSAGTARFTFSYSVTESTVPTAPVWNESGTAQTFPIGAFSRLVVPRVDAGFPEPEYSASGLPRGFVFDAATRTISGTAVERAAGSIVITALNPTASTTLTYPWESIFAAPAFPDPFGEAVVWVLNRTIDSFAGPEAQ